MVANYTPRKTARDPQTQKQNENPKQTTDDGNENSNGHFSRRLAAAAAADSADAAAGVADRRAVENLTSELQSMPRSGESEIQEKRGEHASKVSGAEKHCG